MRCAAAFTAAKQAVKAKQALSVMHSSRPCELDVHVTEDGYGWGLWHWLEWTRQLNGFWSQLWKGAEVQYTLIGNQLAAVYHALLAMEPIARTAPTKVKTTYPIVGWVRDWTQRPRSGMAQHLHWPNGAHIYSSAAPSLLSP